MVGDAMLEVAGRSRKIGGDVNKCMAGIKCKLCIMFQNQLKGKYFSWSVQEICDLQIYLALHAWHESHLPGHPDTLPRGGVPHHQLQARLLDSDHLDAGVQRV